MIRAALYQVREHVFEFILEGKTVEVILKISENACELIRKPRDSKVEIEQIGDFITFSPFGKPSLTDKS